MDQQQIGGRGERSDAETSSNSDFTDMDVSRFYNEEEAS